MPAATAPPGRFGARDWDAWVVPAAAAAALASGAALALAGPVAALGPLVLVAMALLAARPRLLLGIYGTVVVLLENDELGFLPQRNVFYAGAPSVSDLVLAALTVAVVVWLVREGRPARAPEPFTLPLALLALAFAAAAAYGWSSDGDPVRILNSTRDFLPLLLVPFAAVNVLDSERRLVQAAGLALALALVKGIEGIVSWVTESGRVVSGTTLTFYEPATNFLLLVAITGAAAAFLLRVPLPWWGRLAAPLAAAALLLSFRRNFWIAAVLAFLLVLLLSRLGTGRRTLLPTAALLVVGITVGLLWRGTPDLEGPVAERAFSLSPTSVVSDPYDRYRLDEQRNVLAEIRAHPLLGIGLGVPWQLRHPLPVELDDGRFYTHVVLFWYWLKLGLAGAIGYVWLMLSAIVAGLMVYRRASSQVIRLGGLTLFASLAAMTVAETTGSFTGVSDRYTVVVGAALGWLAAARAVERSAAER